VADYSQPGDDGGAVHGKVQWEVETDDKPLELGCGRWYGVEIRATQDLWTCKGFNYRKLHERARKVGGDLIEHSLPCPAACPNLRAKVVKSSWGCKRARVRFLWFHLNLFRAEVRVRWAVGCENAKKLPEMKTEEPPPDEDFERPRPKDDDDDVPDPDYVIREHHGFSGPPKSKELPCNKITTIRYTGWHDTLCPPEDFAPSVTLVSNNAKLYAQSFRCKAPCWPVPVIGVTRTEWRCDPSGDGVEVVLYISFLCTPGVPGDGEGGD
jgi:hypothetical protein